MSEPEDAGHMLELAEQAAMAGDLESADALLRGALRIQEGALGPLHPELANTLNNLAIVAEKTGRLEEAEAFYRRAVAIATDSLPPGDPMIAASRENLEAFCRARGLPIDAPAIAVAPVPDAPASDEPGPDTARAAAKVPGVPAAPERSATPLSVPPLMSAPAAPTAADPLPPASQKGTPPIAWAIGAAAVLVVALLVWRPWSTERLAPASPAPAPPPAAAREQPPPAPPPARPAPVEQPPSPAVAPKNDDRSARDTPRPTRPTPSAAVTLAVAQLCQSFSTNGASWHCVPAGDEAAPGRLVLYTRVKSAADGTVVHRWYRGTALRQSVTLRTLANATQGYRTYSQQTVDGAQEWRVEVRSANGDLLYEQRFAVR
jgi:hypothetical protein